MVIESKDEVIYWFNQLPGATRIDILSALLHHCVPLEIRFLATRIESIARRDYSFFLEDELRANSAADMRVLCSADWLSGITPVFMAPPSPALAPKSNVTESPFSLTDVRYKLVVSLCLLYSTNRQCATLVFNAFRKQLSVKNIKEKLEKTCQMSLTSSTEPSYLTSTDLVNQSSSSPASLSSHGESTSTCSSACSCGTSNCNCGMVADVKGNNLLTGVTRLTISDPKVDQSSSLITTPTNQLSSSSCPSSSSSSSSGTINIDSTSYSSKNANITISPISPANSSSTPIITLPPPQCGTNVTTNTTLMVPSFYLNQEFVSQITLLFSLALCHPAFTFEQQSLLMVQVSASLSLSLPVDSSSSSFLLLLILNLICFSSFIRCVKLPDIWTHFFPPSLG